MIQQEAFRLNKVLNMSYALNFTAVLAVAILFSMSFTFTRYTRRCRER